MPEPPAGEAELRTLSERFREAEARLRVLIGRAPEGDRRRLLAIAIAILVALRREDFGEPVLTAYTVAARTPGRRRAVVAVGDLARSLAHKLDRGVASVQGSARTAIMTATADNVAELVDEGVTAHVDARGARWALGAWAAMNTATIGRQATSRGVADAAGSDGRVTVEVGECDYCAGFAGEAIIGTDPLPPYHPNCSCIATA